MSGNRRSLVLLMGERMGTGVGEAVISDTRLLDGLSLAQTKGYLSRTEHLCKASTRSGRAGRASLPGVGTLRAQRRAATVKHPVNNREDTG
ncbi:hypothetical protein RRG08_028716 [Elysia crispata]|uniref:Uncharacterized protein n=1 Tax=Elysia crispata TaxID=231223 RepID=A0AAE1CLF2_9GAST|nr:hypothetical protein RRG08_028716 [Elysia crispata]